ncbi:MAG TPA: MarR family transcriptional regulator [Kofleriaceae bacterium]|nr:MarR family transcriptional regulator [Kofleriaceae bacterium]
MSAQALSFVLDLHRAHAMVSRRFDAALGGWHGIGLADLHLLVTLDRAPAHRMRRVDLARELGVTPSGVTWMLRPLTKRRLVTSEASEADARVAFAVLTEGGRRLVAEAVPSGRELARELLDGGNKQELVAAAGLIERLAQGAGQG